MNIDITLSQNFFIAHQTEIGIALLVVVFLEVIRILLSRFFQVVLLIAKKGISISWQKIGKFHDRLYAPFKQNKKKSVAEPSFKDTWIFVFGLLIQFACIVLTVLSLADYLLMKVLDSVEAIGVEDCKLRQIGWYLIGCVMGHMLSKIYDED